jgi:hypothetical protein
MRDSVYGQLWLLLLLLLLLLVRFADSQHGSDGWQHSFAELPRCVESLHSICSSSIVVWASASQTTSEMCAAPGENVHCNCHFLQALVMLLLGHTTATHRF